MNSPQLVQAWLRARYELPSPPRRLRIGEPCPALDVQFPRAADFGLLTAYNPGGRVEDCARNAEAQRELRHALAQRDIETAEALNTGAEGGWEEPSLLLVAPGSETLDALARRFGQAGALAWRRGGPVRLRLYRPEWRAAVEAARVDTRFVDWVPCAPP